MPRKINLYYDARMIANSGIGTQIQNVIGRLAAEKNIQLTLLGDPERISQYFPDLQTPVIPWLAPIYSLREQFAYPRPPRDAVLLCPHYNVPLRYLKQTVVILHDLIHLLSSEFESPHYRLYASFMLAQVAEKARRIITVSDYTRQDFTARFPQAEKKTFVNYNGLDHRLYAPPPKTRINAFRKKHQLPGEFLLTVGIAKKHKNVDFVIRSLIPFWQNETLKLPLVMAGTGGQTPDYLTALLRDRAVGDNIIIMPRLELEEMPLLYAASRMLIMPSLLGGFGFPVIEAMASGAPVLCSAAASLPEVGGRAAAYFDPHNPLDFTDALFELLNAPRKLESLAKKGLKQATKFNWDFHADKLARLLGELE